MISIIPRSAKFCVYISILAPGSGKTTVALHRIAYLVYNYIEKIKQNQYLVIGPNPVFLKYIKSVLPELDVNGVMQCTYEEFVRDYINENININISDKKVTESILGTKKFDIDKFKCSIKYRNMLEKFIQLYIYSITSKPLLLGDFEVLSKDEVTAFFQGMESKGLNMKIASATDKIIKYIKMEKDKILLRYSDYSYDLFKKALTDDEKDKMRRMFSKDRMEISKNCKNIIRNYFNKTKLTTTKLYKIFISSIFDYNIYNYEYLSELKKETMKNIKNNTYDFEDLAALLYIKYLISPNRQYEKIKHVVIDEAQDLGEFNFFSIKKALPFATYSIFGDLAQSIYDYRSIANWEEVNNIMFNGNGSIINFNKSYRTTAEIMEAADEVVDSIGLNKSDLVVRHGKEINVTELKQKNDAAIYISKKILEYIDKGYKTIAIISKTNILSENINNELTKLGISIPNITLNDDLSDERFKICTISNQLAKGLEFDAVILNDASEEIYSSSNNLDMKLLYVSMTRALHELDILYFGNLTKPLENYFKEKNKKRILTK